MKKALTLFLVSTFICTTVYAKTYKISPKSTSTQPLQTTNYNVYTPTTYNNQQIQSGVESGGIIEFVIDYSGSMSNVIANAKYTVQRLYPNIPAGTKVGLRVFGQMGGINPFTYISSEVKNIVKNAGGVYKIFTQQPYDCIGNTTGTCSNTIQVLPVGSYNGNIFYQAMDKQNTGGSTPLVFGLHLAVTQDLANFPITSKKKIILITDGGENCGGDPCAFVQKLSKERSDIIIDVIMIGSDKSLACLANETNGNFYTFNGNDLYNGIFDNILMQSIQTAPQGPNKETPVPQTLPSQGNKYEYIPD